jgi:hypothetical protein
MKPQFPGQNADVLPASIRRKASNLNSRLNRLGSLVLNQSSPRKENCHHFPCLSLGGSPGSIFGGTDHRMRGIQAAVALRNPAEINLIERLDCAPRERGSTDGTGGSPTSR